MTDHDPHWRPQQPAPGRAARMFGYLLVTLGGLWTLLSGGCSIFLLVLVVGEVSAARTGQSMGAALESIMSAAPVALVILAPGALMLWGGLAILRNGRNRPPP